MEISKIIVWSRGWGVGRGGWSELKIEGGGWNGGGGGGINGPGGGGNDGGEGGGDRLLLGSGCWQSLNLSKRFWISGSFPRGVGAPFIF